mgnify:CR=1 FL=1
MKCGNTLRTRRFGHPAWAIILAGFLMLGGCRAAAPPQGSALSAIEVHFSPQGGCQDAVVATLDKSARTVDMAAYSFTNKKIAHALAAAKNRGVAVRLVSDQGEFALTDDVREILKEAGIDPQVKSTTGLMHNKYLVIDREVLVTGSYNFTARAEWENFENLLVLRDPELAQRYEKNFERLWALPNGTQQAPDPSRVGGKGR